MSTQNKRKLTLKKNALIFNPIVPSCYKPIWDSNPPKKVTAEDKKIFASLGKEPLGVINEYVLQSGRITGKTTTAADYCFFRFLTIPGANIVVTRAEQNDIRSTVYAAFEKIIFKLTNGKPKGLFKMNKSPFEIVNLVNGNRIIFLAINADVNRSKGLEIPIGYIDVVWHEECNENDGFVYIDSANKTFLRFFKKESKIIYAFNTEQIPAHWSNIKFKELIHSGKAIKVYGTWVDIAKLLDTATIQKILEDRANDLDYYRWQYLGHVVMMKGLVFRQFKRNKHIVLELGNIDVLQDSIASIILSIDGANKNDATACGALCVLNDGRILVLDSLYYDPLKEGQIDDVNLSKLICEWWTKFLFKYPRLKFKQTFGTVDNANWNLLQMLQGTSTLGYFDWIPATNKKVLRDTKRLQNLFGQDIILLYCPADKSTDCWQGRDELESYVYDEKTGEIAKNQRDHFIDMLKYGTFAYMHPNIYNIEANIYT